MDRPSGHAFFKHTVHIFSIVAALGFLAGSRRQPFDLGSTLIATCLPATIHFLLLHLVLYLRSPLRWTIVRHLLDTLLKISFLIALAPLVHALVRRGWLVEIWGLVVVLAGMLGGFVLVSWGVETLLQRLLGPYTDKEARRHGQILERLDALSHWRIAFFLIPNLNDLERTGTASAESSTGGPNES